MMTLEEAIAVLEESKRQNEIMRDNPTTFWASYQIADGIKNTKRRIDALDAALTALRPVSREQVEQMWPGCDYCKHAWMEGLDLKPCANGNIGVELAIGRTYKDDAFGILAYYRNTAAGYIDFPFCPFCGRPMTDEAVQAAMERLKVLHGETD